YCCICDHHVLRFLPYRGWRDLPPLILALEGVGSDVRQFGCPRCASHDRERHLALYFSKLAIYARMAGATILHFAPERHLSRLIRERGPARYVKCDLYPVAPDVVKIDMMDIPFPDQTFDIIIANHVLEHVGDDLSALKELYRVCKTGGIAILQTPYSAKLHSTLSDPGVDSDQARLQLYGQEDHVRLYGRDIFERFSSVGFVAKVASHADVLSDVDAQRYGVNRAEPLFLFTRS
ncbi:MAG: methyltransferase domain-containing protein, partial [Burkholderiaceae bacterium]|nr:methyltransferase domain-containing protein [Burkholderiaceae bacterium]